MTDVNRFKSNNDLYPTHTPLGSWKRVVCVNAISESNATTPTDGSSPLVPPIRVRRFVAEGCLNSRKFDTRGNRMPGEGLLINDEFDVAQPATPSPEGPPILPRGLLVHRNLPFISKGQNETPAKPRRRNQFSDSAPAAKPGQNRFGRKGTRRCIRCRFWRQKCEYDRVELACTVCTEKGFSCTAEDKVWGPNKERTSSPAATRMPERHGSLLSIFQTPQLPVEERLDSNDWRHLESYYAMWSPDSHGRPKLLLPCRPGSRMMVPIYNVGLAYSSSSLFNLAVLVLMSYLKNETANQETFEYAGRFFSHAQSQAKEYANSNGAMPADVVYSGYIMAVYALLAEASSSTTVSNCLLFASSLSTLRQSRSLRDDEVSWMEDLWQGVAISLYHALREMLFRDACGPTEWRTSFAQLQEFFDRSTCLLPTDRDLESLPMSMTTEVICQKVEILSIFLQFYLEHFLFRMTYHTGAEAVDTIQFLAMRLQDVLRRIITLISHLSNIRDYIIHAYDIRMDMTPTPDGRVNGFLQFPDVQPCGLKSVEDPVERDTALPLLYSFAQLLKALMDSVSPLNENNETALRDSAVAICRLCASFWSSDSPMVSRLAKRSLFWAGIILKQSKYPHGGTFLNRSHV